MRSTTRVGVYVDVANINRNGGFGMGYEILREFACRDQAEAMRLNAYVSYDAEKARRDSYLRWSRFDGHETLLAES